MLNRVFSFFNKGTIVQNNINVVNIDLLPFMKNLKKDFFDGNIKKYDELNEYIEKYNNDKKNLYSLLILKVHFLLQLFKFNEFEKLLNYLEENYKEFLDIKFDELKLTLLSFKENKSEFEKLVVKFKIEKDIPEEYFEMMYYLNNDIKQARTIYDSFKEKNSFNILYNGFLIYSKLYEMTQQTEYFEIADNIAKEVKERKGGLNFFEKLSINGFYGLSKINNFLKGKKDNIDFDINNYKKLIEVIIENKEYFDKEYQQKVINIYLYILLYQNNIKKYIEISLKYIDLISNFHYLNYLNLKNKKLNHQVLQEKAKQNNEDFIFYISLLFEKIGQKDKEEIKEFLLSYDEEFILKNDYLVYIYFKFFAKIPITIKKYVKKNKYKNLYILISFLNLSKNNTNEDLNKLIQFAEKENNIFGLIYDVLIILQKNKKIKELINLAIKKQKIFKNIVFETLKIIYDDYNITYNNFQYFLENIKIQKEHYAIIGNIFVKFERYKEAFEYFWNVYEENKDNIEVIIALLRLIWNYYNISDEILDKDKQIEIFSNLLSKSKQLSLNDVVFLFYYSLYLIKDTNQTIYILNQKLLNINENDFNDELFNYITRLYLLQYEVKYKNLFFVEDNKCLVDKEHKTIYIKQDYDFNNFDTKLLIKKIDEIEYLALKEKGYKEESLLHIILPNIIFKEYNPNLIAFKVDTNSNDPLKELFDSIEKDKQNEIELFKKFADGNNVIGLYNLAKYDYKNYFTLIPYLLNSKWNFNSLELNYLNRPKILTFSSIVFLDELNLLDKVLQRNDIVIQKSLINWLKRYIEEIDYNNLPLDYEYLNGENIKFEPYTKETIKKAELFKKRLIRLIQKLNKCNLIDDHLEILPIKESFNILSDQIGFQEYWALVYCINHNYQIISENNIFKFLFGQFNLNELYISNSLSLLNNDDYINIVKRLYKQNYKYIVPKSIEEVLIEISFKRVLSFNQVDKILIKEANKYGFLERIKKYYYYKFEVLYPKNNLSKKTFFDKNIEKIIKIIKE